MIQNASTVHSAGHSPQEQTFLLILTHGHDAVGGDTLFVNDLVARCVIFGRSQSQRGSILQRDDALNRALAESLFSHHIGATKVLQATKIKYSVIEMNRSLAAAARREGASVLLGDAAQHSILLHAGLETAKALVIAIDDQQATRLIVAQAHAARPTLFILARTRFVTEVDELYKLGASGVIPEEFETSIEIFAHVLKEFHIPDNVIEAQIAMVRAGRYGMLRGMPTTAAQRMELIHMLEASATQTFLLPAGSPASGRTLRETDLRAKSGVTIIALVRNGEAMTNPAPDSTLQTGDVLVLVGVHKQLDAAKMLLAPPDIASNEV